MVLCMAQGHAQNHRHRDLRNSLNEFRTSIREDFEDFRKQCIQEYAEFLSNPWKEFEGEKPVPVPKEEPVPPVVMPKEDNDKPIKDKPVVIEEVIKPVIKETPQPKPVEPIKEVPVVKEKYVDFTFFGTRAKVRFDKSDVVHLSSCNEQEVANAVKKMTSASYDNLLVDCLKLRKDLELSDWAYLQMLKAIGQEICGHFTNDATLLQSFLYMQSGYQMRLAQADGKLYMLYASRHHVYNQNYYRLNGMSYYCMEKMPNNLHICQASFPNEKSMSLLINTNQKFALAESELRTITSEQYSDMKVSVSVNKNLIDFYDTYPTSMIDGDNMTRWAMYANTPLDEVSRVKIMEPVKQQVAGLPQIDAANRLLNWVQTGFVYEYDDKVWGGDRAFFAEESLYYPYCDCEDRSILFSRLVRDLLGLEVVLVYYPGHLATAVHFTEDVKGDYLLVNGTRFVVCDPTYIGAPVGRTMPKMDNASARVILLK